MKEQVQDKVLLLPIMILLVHFFMRIMDFAKIVISYPLHSEAVTQLAQLFFLDVCGFHSYCSYWYNGFTTFLVTPPMWYFFAYPFYAISNSVLIGAYASLIATYVIVFLAIYWLGNLIGLTPLKRVLFFALVFANNILIKNMSFGRFHEVFAWAMFIITFLMLVRYKDKKIDEKAILIPVFAALTITAHQSIGILMMILFVGFLLVKRGRELAKAIGLFLLSLAASAFWLIPAFLEAKKNVLADTSFIGTEAFWSFPAGTLHFTSIALIVLPLVIFIAFYSYYKVTHKSRKEIVFFLPALGVMLFLWLGIMPFIPVMNVVFTNMYLQFGYILLAFFIVKTYPYDHEYRFVYLLGLSLMAVAMLVVNFLGTPWFQEPTSLENSLVNMGDAVHGKYVFLGSFPTTSLPPAYYGYFAIYNNLTTPGGWAPHIRDENYLKKLVFFKKNEFTCEELQEHIEYFKVRYVFAYDQRCRQLDKCDYVVEREDNKACLYKVA